MANTLASILRRRGQSKLLRLDHSDVYFENDRLDQDLTYDINTIQREKYRQQLNRDAQIVELKKAFSMHQRSASSANLFKAMERKTSPQQLTTSLNTSLQAKSAPVKRPESVFSDSESSTTSIDLGKKINSKGRLPQSVRMPKANSALFDNSDTTSSRESDILDTDSEIEYTAPPMKLPGAAPKSAPVSRRSRINAMLRSLRLDAIPPHWYTTVVPAKDVHVNYYIDTAGSSRKRPERPHTTNPSSLRPSKSRGSTRSAKSKHPIHAQKPEMVTTSCQPTMKTRRQLQEISDLDNAIGDSRSLELHRKIEENKLKTSTIDKKVKEFLEVLKKSQNKKFSTVI